MRPKKNPGAVASGPGPGRGRGRGGGRTRTHVDDEEDERRRLRRERNKLAAARCRKRRVDHTQNLIEETEELEARKKSIQEEIQKLNSQCEELSFILESHQNQRKIKSEFEDQENYSICKLHNNNNNSNSNKNNNTIINNNNNNNNKSSTKRPTTLPIVPSGKITRQSSVIKKSPTSQAASVIVANLTPTPSQLITPSTGLFDWSSEFHSLTGIFTSTNSNSTPASISVINKNTNSLQTPI